MPRSTSRGTCRACGRDFAKSGLTRHLAFCKGRTVSGRTEPGYTLSVTPPWSGSPWFLFLEMPASAQLGDLDGFLRDIWLECCGHLSWFDDPSRKRTTRTMWDLLSDLGPEVSMSTRLSEILKKGKHLDYTYDAGSSTNLVVKAVEERAVAAQGDIVRLLARNHPVPWECSCGKPATLICTECAWRGSGACCEACAASHECGEEMFLPIVNSPRVGVCGYTGPTHDEWA